MSTVAQLKQKAVEFEQKKQFDKALDLYVQILDATVAAKKEPEVALYNRVGDLLVRQGRPRDAVVYYEKAVDIYADGGFLNNAIALCN
jgi:tetratricopeptide (TPR) repeat protein